MNPHLQLAYTLGLNAAREAFEKQAQGEDPGLNLVTGLGAIPLLGPTAAGIASRRTSHEADAPVVGPSTAGRSMKGQLLGGLGGAALGAGGLALAKQLGLDTDIKPSTAALFGGLLGSGVGGAVGARQGRQRSQRYLQDLDQSIADYNSQMDEDRLQQLQQMLEMTPSSYRGY